MYLCNVQRRKLYKVDLLIPCKHNPNRQYCLQITRTLFTFILDVFTHFEWVLSLQLVMDFFHHWAFLFKTAIVMLDQLHKSCCLSTLLITHGKTVWPQLLWSYQWWKLCLKVLVILEFRTHLTTLIPWVFIETTQSEYSLFNFKGKFIVDAYQNLKPQRGAT